MIRAARTHLVRTQHDLAETVGVSLGTFRNQKRHQAPKHPAPISPPGARPILWDGEQTDAYYAGAPVPTLPTGERGDDLLDRNECGDLLHIDPRTWDRYADLPGMQPRPDPVLIRVTSKTGTDAVEHWTRRAVLIWDTARVGSPSGTGRPPGVANLLPVEEIPALTGQLLAADPRITARRVADEIGVSQETAQRALSAARARTVAKLLTANPQLASEEVAQCLNYPTWAAYRAVSAAEAQQRAEAAQPYIRAIEHALIAAGFEVTTQPTVRVRPGNDCVSLLTLRHAPAPFLLWDERWGWRTAPSRPNLSRGETTPPRGTGIRYLCRKIAPKPADVVSALQDPHIGTNRPAHQYLHAPEIVFPEGVTRESKNKDTK